MDLVGWSWLQHQETKEKMNKNIIIGVSILILLVFTVYASSFIDNNQANFDSGEYNQTYYNQSGFVQLNLTNNNGTYLSEIFDSGSNGIWNNITFAFSAFGDLPDNQEIETEYGSRNINMTGNTLLMHLDESSGTIIDSSGEGYDASPTNFDGDEYGIQGILNDALIFDGVNDILIGSSSNDIMGDYLQTITFAVWVKHTDTGDNGYIASLKRSASASTLISLDAGNSGAGNLGFLTRNHANTAHSWLNYDGGYNDGEWHHLVAVVDGLNRMLYIDGILRNSDTQGMQNVSGNTAEFCVGGFYPTNLIPFEGSIDEIAIWNRTLSPDELLNIYKRGVTRLNLTVRSCNDLNCNGEQWINANDSSPQNLNVIDNKYFQYKLLFTSLNNLYSPLLYNVSVDVDINSMPIHNTPILNSSAGSNFVTENLTIYNVSTADAELDSIKNIINWYKDGTSLTILNMPFEGGSTSGTNNNNGTTRDYSGLGNATVVKATWNSSAGHDGKGAYKFSGNDSYIDINDSSLSSHYITVSAWAKSDTIDYSYYGHIVNKVQTNPGTYILLIDAVTDKAGFSIRLDGDENSFYYASADSAIDTNWHHYVGTYDGDKVKLYIDNVLQSTIDDTDGTIDTDNSGILRIGAHPTLTENAFDGIIDDVMIYNYAISPEQIDALYNNRIDLIHHNETSPTEVWNASITPNDGYQDGEILWSNSLEVLQLLQPNLTISKTDLQDPVHNGSLLSYTITIANIGEGNATNVTLIETYPEDTTFISSNPSPNINTNDTFTLGTITNNQTIFVNITIQLNEEIGSGQILNLVNVTYFNTSNELLYTTDQEQTTTYRLNESIDPIVSLISPESATIFRITSVELNVSVIDNSNLENCTLWTNISGIWAKNTTESLIGTSDWQSWQFSNLNPTTYIWNAYCYDNVSNGAWHNENYSFIILPDYDDDNVANSLDSLEGNASFVNTGGIIDLIVKIDGNTNLAGTFSGQHYLEFFDNQTPLLNFTHNYSVSEINLSRTSINVTDEGIVINLSGMLATGEYKTLYLEDYSYKSLCVRNAMTSSIEEISEDCSDEGEIDFTSCINSETAVNIDGVTCLDLGNLFRIGNLTYSGASGIRAAPSRAVSGGGGGGYSGGAKIIVKADPEDDEECEPDWWCGHWEDCKDGMQRRYCADIYDCGTNDGLPEETKECEEPSLLIIEDETNQLNLLAADDQFTEYTSKLNEKPRIFSSLFTNIEENNLWPMLIFVALLTLITLLTFIESDQNYMAAALALALLTITLFTSTTIGIISEIIILGIMFVRFNKFTSLDLGLNSTQTTTNTNYKTKTTYKTKQNPFTSFLNNYLHKRRNKTTTFKPSPHINTRPKIIIHAKHKQLWSSGVLSKKRNRNLDGPYNRFKKFMYKLNKTIDLSLTHLLHKFQNYAVDNKAAEVILREDNMSNKLKSTNTSSSNSNIPKVRKINIRQIKTSKDLILNSLKETYNRDEDGFGRNKSNI
jgi:uncharacterized repeat protein (TIGR01451 family)